MHLFFILFACLAMAGLQSAGLYLLLIFSCFPPESLRHLLDRFKTKLVERST